jgi:transmembrane sensor
VTKVSKRQLKEGHRRREAAQWFVENESGQELTSKTSAEWNVWVGDPANRDEYAEMIRLDQAMSGLPRPRASNNADLLEDSFEVPPLQPPATTPVHFRGRMRAVWGERRFAVAAGWIGVLVIAVGLLVLFRLDTPAVSPLGERAYATGPGEQREFTLADGSHITLGGDTAVTVHFTAHGRLVALSHGEGMFRVQHDKDRPFTVCAAVGCTTAVGTVFDVRLYSNHVRVWVQEGTVEVAPFNPVAVGTQIAPQPFEWIPLRVAHGQEMSYDNTGDASAPKRADARAAAAWTEGSLIYHARPLTEVVEDVQRYFARPMLLDPAAADLQYSGSVLQRHVDQWIRGLSEVFPVETIDCHDQGAQGVPACATNPDRILIRSRTTP